MRPRARADLRDIGDYADPRWGKAQAQRYLEAIADSFDQIAKMPLAGSDQADVSPGLRNGGADPTTTFIACAVTSS